MALPISIEFIEYLILRIQLMEKSVDSLLSRKSKRVESRRVADLLTRD